MADAAAKRRTPLRTRSGSVFTVMIGAIAVQTMLVVFAPVDDGSRSEFELLCMVGLSAVCAGIVGGAVVSLLAPRRPHVHARALAILFVVVSTLVAAASGTFETVAIAVGTIFVAAGILIGDAAVRWMRKR